MSKSSSSSSSGVGFFGLLFIVFLVLKLMGYIVWSWWWVTAPLWGPMVLLVAFLLTALLTALLIFPLFVGGVFLCEAFRQRKKR